MNWDGKNRRISDRGKEPAAIIWARIDERVNTLIENALEVKKDLIDHKKEDEIQFKAINKTISWATGGLAMFIFILNLFKH